MWCKRRSLLLDPGALQLCQESIRLVQFSLTLATLAVKHLWGVRPPEARPLLSPAVRGVLPLLCAPSGSFEGTALELLRDASPTTPAATDQKSPFHSDLSMVRLTHRKIEFALTALSESCLFEEESTPRSASASDDSFNTPEPDDHFNKLRLPLQDCIRRKVKSILRKSVESAERHAADVKTERKKLENKIIENRDVNDSEGHGLIRSTLSTYEGVWLVDPHRPNSAHYWNTEGMKFMDSNGTKLMAIHKEAISRGAKVTRVILVPRSDEDNFDWSKEDTEVLLREIVKAYHHQTKSDITVHIMLYPPEPPTPASEKWREGFVILDNRYLIKWVYADVKFLGTDVVYNTETVKEYRDRYDHFLDNALTGDGLERFLDAFKEEQPRQEQIT